MCLAAARVSAPHLFMPSTRHGAKISFKLIFQQKVSFYSDVKFIAAIVCVTARKSMLFVLVCLIYLAGNMILRQKMLPLSSTAKVPPYFSAIIFMLSIP